MLPEWIDETKVRLIDLIREEVISLARLSSNRSHMDQLKKSEILQLLRVGLGDSNLEVRRKSARALVSTRLFSKKEVPAIMEAMLAGISNRHELSDTLDAFWTVLTVVESESAKRKVAERLCEFVEGWQSPDDSSEEDDMSEALRFLSFRRREAVGGRKEGTTKPEVPDELIDRLLNSSHPTIRKRAVLLWRRFWGLRL